MNVLNKILIKIPSVNTNATQFSSLARLSTFKSAISLDKLYPSSSLKLSTPVKPNTKLHEKFDGFIPLDQLEITYSRSSGPGGQNVNKVNTKVDVRFQISTASWLHDDVKSKLEEKFKNKTTRDGYVVFKSDLTRSQQMNLADCLEKIRKSIRACLYEPEPVTQETEEKLRRRHEKAVRERLAAKRERSRTKSERSAPIVDI